MADANVDLKLAASAHDNAAGISLLDKVAAGTDTVQKSLVDPGSKNTVVDHGEQEGIEVEVVGNPKDAGFTPQPKRWIVEQTNGILMLHRTLVRDYEHRPASTESRVYWAIGNVMVLPAPPPGPGAGHDRRGADLGGGAGTPSESGVGDRRAGRGGEGAGRAADRAAGRTRPGREEIRITRKTLLELPDPPPSAPPASKLPDHPTYQQIMAVFAAADAPLRARRVCEAMDLEIAPNNINNTRLQLKRLAERGILVETEQGLFTPHPATTVTARRRRSRPACHTDVNSRTTLSVQPLPHAR